MSGFVHISGLELINSSGPNAIRYFNPLDSNRKYRMAFTVRTVKIAPVKRWVSVCLDGDPPSQCKALIRLRRCCSSSGS